MDVSLESKYLESLGKGDHEAFNMLFMTYHNLVKQFLLGFIKDEEDALDIAQEVFYQIWVHRETVSQVDSFKQYLFRMTRNAVYNHYKLNAIRKEHMRKYQQQSSIVDELPEAKIYADELGLLLDIAVENMPPQRKRIFKMSRKEGLSNEEISRRLNINKRTVENHITAALADLRKILKIIFIFFL